MDGLDLNLEADQNTLILEIHGLAHRYARRRLVERADAEDVGQDVVLHCLRRLREGTWRLGDRSLKAHVSCLVNRRITVLGLRRRRWELRDMEYLRDLEASVREWMDPEAGLAAPALETVYDVTMAKLPQVRREVFELVRGENLSYETVAQRLGVTVAALKKHVLRAQRAFRSALAVEGIEVEKGWRPKLRKGPRRRRRPVEPTGG